jgi:hypothetical protein
MWWSNSSWVGGYWMPWMFFGPVMMILLMATCVAIPVFIMRGARIHRHRAAGAGGMMTCCGTGLGPSLERFAAQHPENRNLAHTDGSPAFDEYRAETLRRLEREQSEFQEFVEHLRVAKDKAEFDQFVTERRTPPPLPRK